jgi:hypothetical protein
MDNAKVVYPKVMMLNIIISLNIQKIFLKLIAYVHDFVQH